MPLVTIITPSYNSQKYFLDTFHSVLNQTFKDYEWIIIDDCSTDDSFNYVQNLIKDYPNIQIHQTDQNGGSAKARNVALKLAKGKYITFLDADDLLDENYLQEQASFIKDNGPLITAGYRRLADHTTTDFMPRKSITYKEALKGNDTSCLTTMYDREIIQNVYFPEDLKRQEDYVFWLEILSRGYIAKCNSQVLATYRIIPGSKNRSKIKLIKPMFDIYHKKQHFSFLKSCIFVMSWALYGFKKYRNVR